MFSSIQDIERYLLQLIPDSTQLRFPGSEGIVRTKEFLRLLGSPQNKLKVIHVAGTSGKGSTSFLISHLLHAHGFNVGLSLSPHLLDIRERMEINNELLSTKTFARYFNEILPSIEKMRHSSYGKITYFEAMVGLTYHAFAQERVDYAVIETGLGGEFDGTNIVERNDKLSVLSRVGFDHMKVLGNSLPEIAHQKAMICAERGELISIYQYPTAATEIKKVVAGKKGLLFTIKKTQITRCDITRNETNFTFEWDGILFKDLSLGLLGAHQIQNCSLALAVLCRIHKRDGFKLDMGTITSKLKSLRFKGRFDLMQKNGGRIILDGAHNIPKMKALLKTLIQLFPGDKFTFVIAFKKGKEYKKMIQLIVPLAQDIIITHIFSESQDLQHFSVSPESILLEIKKTGFSKVTIIKNIKDIIGKIKSLKNTCVISGSLYLLGDIYKELD